jgi:hypothetical protein
VLCHDEPMAGRASARWRGPATVAAVAALAVGYVLLAGAVLVRGHLLDERLYHDALARADAYQRAYTDVLADPAVADTTEELLGRLDLRGVEPEVARVVATNALRWAVPPAVLREGTERLIASTVAYLRGDVDRVEASLDLVQVLDRLEEVAARQVRTVLASVGEQVAGSLAEYRAAVVSAMDDVAGGRIPSAVPVAAATVARQAVASVLLEEVVPRTGADPVAVEALVEAGNGRDALITAVAPVVADRAETARRGLEERLEGGRAFDAVAQLAARADGSEVRVLSTLNTIRDLAGTFGAVSVGLGLVLVAAGAGVLVAVHRDDPRRVALTFAAGLVAAGVATLGVWLGLRWALAPPLRDATGSGAGTWDLPAGLRGLVRDVEANLAASLAAVALRLVRTPLVAGAVLGALTLGATTVRRSAPRAPLVGVAAGGAVAAGALAWFLAAPAAPAEPCNGHVELCDRRYDEIVQAATHNSMSSPDVVKVWPEQDETIREQLDSGIRVLLIDTHHWTEVLSPEQLVELDPGIPLQVAAAALDREGGRFAARPGTYLCHNHCIWGGVPLVDALGDVRDFLEDNPREVVTLIIQDAISPAETEAAFDAAGLLPHLHVHDPDAGWATLGTLIERGDRLIVFAEEEGPPPAWYHSAFEHIADTPFRFRSFEELSCEPNRGPPDAPLLLANHWISAAVPDRRNAVLLNDHEALVARARACEAERGRLPSYLAVDFSSIGDLLRAVDTLNGVDRR